MPTYFTAVGCFFKEKKIFETSNQLVSVCISHYESVIMACMIWPNNEMDIKSHIVLK